MNKNDKKKQTTQELDLNKILQPDSSSFSTVEAYKVARTNIMFSLAEETGCKKIVVTSALPAEGKTTSTLNLGIVFAQVDARVLVVDADLRRPKIHQYLGEKNKEGLADYLAGFAGLKDIIRTREDLHLDYISSGHIPPNPAELLSSSKMEEMLSELSESYDYILIDTPPVTVVADALVLAKLVSGVLVIAKQKQTPHDALKKTMASLEFAEAKVLGFLINETVQEKRYYSKKYYKYGYKYGYRYGYGYGYGYGQEEEQK